MLNVTSDKGIFDITKKEITIPSGMDKTKTKTNTCKVTNAPFNKLGKTSKI